MPAANSYLDLAAVVASLEASVVEASLEAAVVSVDVSVACLLYTSDAADEL